MHNRICVDKERGMVEYNCRIGLEIVIQSIKNIATSKIYVIMKLKSATHSKVEASRS